MKEDKLNDLAIFLDTQIEKLNKLRMKTPKQEAESLFNEMYNVSDELHKYPMCFDTAKLASIIAVRRILKIAPTQYWLKVEQELINYKYGRIKN